MAEQQKYIDQLRERDLLIATEKDITLMAAIALWGLNPDNVFKFEPEKERQKGDEVFPAQNEPASEDPATAVEFKIRRALEFYKEKSEELTVMAGDVVLKVKHSDHGEGVHYHRLARHTTDESHDVSIESDWAHIEELWERYCLEPFTAEWHVAFGMYDKGETRYRKIIVEAEYDQPLDRVEVFKQYNPRTSAGINLLEMAPSGFRIKLNPEDEGIVIHRELAEQLVVKKVPTEEMIAQLMGAEIVAKPEQYSLIFQALATAV